MRTDHRQDNLREYKTVIETERNASQQGTCGFTVVEVMVAVAILFIGFVGVAELFSGGVKNRVIAEEYLTASLWSRQKMEELFATDSLSVAEEEGEFDETYGWKFIVSEWGTDEDYLDEEFYTDETLDDISEFGGRFGYDRYLLELEVFWPLEAPKQKIALTGVRSVVAESGALF